MNLKYRERIYSSYVKTHISRTDLQSHLLHRKPYMEILVKRYFPENRSARIMELGCGYGALIYYAERAGYTNVEGVDVSPEQVEEAARLGIHGVRQGDLLEKLKEAADSSVEMVIAFDVIEHFTKDELIEFTDQVYRVLADKGTWLLHQPNAASPFFGRIMYGDFSHELAFTASSLTQFLKASGFRDITCYEDTPVIHGVKSLARWLGWKLVRFLLAFYLLVETGTSKEVLTQNFLATAKK